MSDDRAEDGHQSDGPWEAFGSYLRSQRRLAQLSLRQLAELTRISNPYLSQIERGLHQPSVAIIRSLGEALGLSVEELLAQAAGIVGGTGSEPGSTEAAIRNDPRLNEGQKGALLAVYRSMVAEGPAPSAPPAGAPPADRPATSTPGTETKGTAAPDTPTRPQGT